MKVIFWLCSFLSAVASLRAQLWEPMGGGLDYQVAELSADSVMQGMFVTGNYRHAGDSTCNGIAFWDGQDFRCFGIGALDSSCITDFTICRMVYTARQFDGQVFASGDFRFMGGDRANALLARWDGSRWYPCGMPNTLTELEVIGNELYALGAFDTISGKPIRKIAKWDGTEWVAVGPSITEGGGWVNAGTYHLGELVMIGNFGVPGRVVKLTSAGWEPLGGGVGSGAPNCLATYRNQLFLGGYFFESQGNAKNHLQAWDGQSWYDPFPNVEFVSHVRNIKVVDDVMYISSTFYIEKEMQWYGPYSLAKYDGVNFCAFGGASINGYTMPTDIEGWDDELYIATGHLVQSGDTLWGAMRWAGGDSVEMCTGQLVHRPEPVVAGEQVSVYPNPATDGFSLDFGEGAVRVASVSVLDLNGRVVMGERSYRAGDPPVDVSMLRAGVYVVQVRTRAGVENIKLVVN